MPASELILQAELWAAAKWPFLPRLFTFIDPTKVKPTKVRGRDVWGWTWRKAGWRQCDQTQNGLLVFEKLYLPAGVFIPWTDGLPVRKRAIQRELFN